MLKIHELLKYLTIGLNIQNTDNLLWSEIASLPLYHLQQWQQYCQLP